MLKTIRVDQVRLGMHLQSLCGSWISHPFWNASFVLCEPGDLAKLRSSGVRECVIDLSRGFDVEEAAAMPPTRQPPASSAAPAATVAAPAPPNVGFADESRRAAVLVAGARSAVESLFGEARMGRALDASGCIDLVHEVTASVWRNSGALVSLARLKTHDDYTYMHSVAVCALMVGLARQLGQNEAVASEAGMAGLLHDVGKAALSNDILNKPGKLSDAEWVEMRTHPLRGHELLQASAGFSDTARDVCLHHHERPDGEGYPHRLAGSAISVPASMGAVCDVYDAITSARSYKAAWDPAEAIARMASWRHGQFDDNVFQAFVRSLGIYPAGSLVRMRSGRLAVVVEQHPTSMVTPKVRIFFSTKSKMPLPLELLDLSQPACNDRIAGRESNADWQFPHLQELWVEPDVLHRMRKRD